MITYDKLWETMKEKGVSQYMLIKEYHIKRDKCVFHPSVPGKSRDSKETKA